MGTVAATPDEERREDQTLHGASVARFCTVIMAVAVLPFLRKLRQTVKAPG